MTHFLNDSRQTKILGVLKSSEVAAKTFKGVVHKGRPASRGRRVQQMRTHVLLFVEGERGRKMVKFCGRPFWMPPKGSTRELGRGQHFSGWVVVDTLPRFATAIK